MDLPLPPRLTRQHATFVEVKSDPKSVALCAQIVKAYHNLPFRGPVLELIPGVIAVRPQRPFVFFFFSPRPSVCHTKNKKGH
mmetsp:Transcript_28155/g.90766  ORF Transcript_28155/g.90766 Transcript_28155/m.90766 type:complete len:82 (+) Transcript_28155:99-344(+)